MKFSVLVANYNNGKYLGDLLESVFLQTYNNWELIIVDDFSTDNSWEILEKYNNNDRIKILRHFKNLGAAAAFKSAADMANGEIFGMLGADDALLPNAIEVMVDAHFQNENASLICSNLYKCNEEMVVDFLWDKYSQPYGFGSLILNVSVGSFATFKRLKYLETSGFDSFFKRALDHDIYLKLEEKGHVLFIDKPLYLYRSNPIGISQNNNWSEALRYSNIARKNAYFRRKEIASIINLSRCEYRNIMYAVYCSEARLSYTQKKPLALLKSLLCLTFFKAIMFFRF
jgi:glycosyltransferase involved in cell wall biosynthesis